jgi:gluconolactonase
LKQKECISIIKGLNFPEGPVFDFSGNLWFVEIKGGNLSCWDGYKLERIDVDGTPNGATIDKKGKIWFCDRSRGEIRRYDPFEKSFKTICEYTINGDRLKCPNDLIFDSEGNLLFSDHANGRDEPLSTICVLPRGSNRAKIISSNKYFTNGLALAKDCKTLIFSETYRQQLWIAEWDAAKLEIQNERHFAKAGKGPYGPDGIAFDHTEQLFVTIFNENHINIYSLEGKLIEGIDCHGSRPTSCAFDPSGKLGLVVTEAEKGEIFSYPDLGNGLPIFYGEFL